MLTSDIVATVVFWWWVGGLGVTLIAIAIKIDPDKVKRNDGIDNFFWVISLMLLPIFWPFVLVELLTDHYQ